MINSRRVVLQKIEIVVSVVMCLAVLLGVLPFSAQAKTDDNKKVVRVGWFESTYNQTDAVGRKTGYSYEYQRKLAAYTGW